MESKHIYGLIYVSEAIDSFSELALLQLCELSSLNNSQLEVTGWLHYYDNRFIQYLEGDKLDVEALFSRICRDKRHRVIHTIEFENLANRLFYNWHMTDIKTVFSDHIGFEQTLMNLIDFMNQNQNDTKSQRSSALRVLKSMSSLQA